MHTEFHTQWITTFNIHMSHMLNKISTPSKHSPPNNPTTDVFTTAPTMATTCQDHHQTKLESTLYYPITEDHFDPSCSSRRPYHVVCPLHRRWHITRCSRLAVHHATRAIRSTDTPPSLPTPHCDMWSSTRQASSKHLSWTSVHSPRPPYRSRLTTATATTGTRLHKQDAHTSNSPVWQSTFCRKCHRQHICIHYYVPFRHIQQHKVIYLQYVSSSIPSTSNTTTPPSSHAGPPRRHHEERSSVLYAAGWGVQHFDGRSARMPGYNNVCHGHDHATVGDHDSPAASKCSSRGSATGCQVEGGWTAHCATTSQPWVCWVVQTTACGTSQAARAENDDDETRKWAASGAGGTVPSNGVADGTNDPWILGEEESRVVWMVCAEIGGEWNIYIKWNDIDKYMGR